MGLLSVMLWDSQSSPSSVPNNITETLDKFGFIVFYDDESNTWSIIDTVDEDGFREMGIAPKDKQKAILSAYEFVLEKFIGV